MMKVIGWTPEHKNGTCYFYVNGVNGVDGVKGRVKYLKGVEDVDGVNGNIDRGEDEDEYGDKGKDGDGDGDGEKDIKLDGVDGRDIDDDTDDGDIDIDNGDNKGNKKAVNSFKLFVLNVCSNISTNPSICFSSIGVNGILGRMSWINFAKA